ncbi:T-cell immunoglobulin and mucin domain-containing protein 4-like isoform X1 [Sinocyclocheilus anshuiensis]|uniref:T-cell immunoglobulin and mucin domain-containing protein 4-like isoform X1 n=1 Tax=Sinocyclocheilus anshuiensis TaxID=1608454 RepID=UPI0007BA858A|nr:PREDICTED: T-cell immunoglobulin and mucin domain-containing protein 4-like isoform X1 [Sinocyclocheilus anshuiensis]
MNDLHSWFFASWVLCYLTISKCSDVIVQSFEGERVILPCKYDSKYHGKCHICWTIGDIPNMGCGNEIIGSDGDKVVRKISSRYQLAGEIQRGDVSLTILNIEKKDSGKYGCRIHVPGLFNDEMYYVHLIVNDALIPTTWKTTSMSSSTSEHEPTGVFSTAMTEVETNTTQESASFAFSTNPPKSRTFGLWLSDTTYETSFDHRESSSMEKKDSVNTSAVIVPVILLLLALIVIAVILILKQKKKNRAAVDITQNSENSVIYSNSGSSVGLYNREMAVENIYQIQAENEYEQWH